MRPLQPPPRADWDFSLCPREELFECNAYEYAREVEVVRRDAASLRKALPKEFDELVRALRRRIDKSARVAAMFWYCPEFPNKAYLDIPVSERRQRLRRLWPPATSAVAIRAKIIPPDIGQKLAAARVIYGPVELALFEINWSESDTFLADAFSNWLSENRPSHIETYETRGAGNIVRQWEDDLKALAAKRLLQRLGSWTDAFNVTFEAIGRTRGRGMRKRRVGLYCDREEAWHKARRKAEAIISGWERAYSSNRFD